MLNSVKIIEGTLTRNPNAMLDIENKIANYLNSVSCSSEEATDIKIQFMPVQDGPEMAYKVVAVISKKIRLDPFSRKQG